VARRKPYLKPDHTNLRLQFAKAHINEPMEYWRKVVWSDESSFELFRSDGRALVYRQSHEEYRLDCVQPTVKHGGGSVMVWACFSSGGVGDLAFIDGNMCAADYKNILAQHLKPSATAMGIDGDFTFQQDNSSIHKAQTVQDYFKDKGVQVLKWPSSSPDLNPMEHIWNTLKCEVAKKRARNKDDLKRHLGDAWHALDREYLDKLVSSIPRRLAEVIKNKGGPTKY